MRLLWLPEQDMGGWVKFRECGELLYGEFSSKGERSCLQEACMASNSVWKWGMVPEGK